MDQTLKEFLQNLNGDLEIEYVYKGHKLENNINILKQFLNKLLNNPLQSIKELDISINELFSFNNNIRATIDGIHIKDFCENEEQKAVELLSDETVTTFQKKQIKDKSTDNNLNFHLNKKEEINLNDSDENKETFKKYYNISTKFYRYKDRTSYYYPKDSDKLNYHFKIDITFVKETKSTNLKFSNIENSTHYEIELEFNKNINFETNDIDILTKKSIDYLKLIYLIMTNNTFIYKTNDDGEHRVVNIKKDFEKKTNDNLIKIREEYNDFCKSVKLENIGPKPVSINYKDIHNMEDIDIKNWSVTDKADGERYILFINSELEVYLINSYYVIYMSTLPEQDEDGNKNEQYKNTIIDGELINSIPINNDNKMKIFDDNFDIKSVSKESYSFKYCAFDIYYIGGINDDDDIKRIYNKNLDERQNELKKLEKILKVNETIEYVNKTYVLLTEYKDIINNYKTTNIINYNLDGLILIPNSEIGDNNIKSTWYKNLKWKPKMLNTIDFRIKFLYNEPDNNSIINNINNINIQLYSVNKNIEILFGSGIDPYIHIKKQKIHYECIGVNYFKTLDGNVIHNNDIVECVLNPESYEWFFIKIRHDKKKPNNYWIANKTWFNLFNTIELTELFNYKNTIENYNNLLKLSYYNSNERLVLSESDRYRKYNNKVKNLLINYCFNILNSEKINVLDLACGRGGDLNKVFNFNNKMNLYLGIDIDMNNITSFDISDQNKNNARARYTQILSKYISSVDDDNIIKKNNVYFVCGDLNKIDGDSNNLEIFQKSIEENDYIKEEDFKDIFKNNKRYDLETLQQISKDNYNIKFNFIQMQFAIHYIDNLKQFLLKINNLLDDNGIFLFTYLDSTKLDDNYEDAFQSIKKLKDENGDTKKLNVKLKTMEGSGQEENALQNEQLKTIINETGFELIKYKEIVNEYEGNNNVFNNIVINNNMLLNKNNSYMILKKKQMLGGINSQNKIISFIDKIIKL